MKSAHVTVTLLGHEGWVRDTISLPLELSVNIDGNLVDCQIVSEHQSSVELERPFDAKLLVDWSDDWDGVDMRGRVFALQYGQQVLGQARFLSGLS